MNSRAKTFIPHQGKGIRPLAVLRVLRLDKLSACTHAPYCYIRAAFQSSFSADGPGELPSRLDCPLASDKLALGLKSTVTTSSACWGVPPASFSSFCILCAESSPEHSNTYTCPEEAQYAIARVWTADAAYIASTSTICSLLSYCCCTCQKSIFVPP